MKKLINRIKNIKKTTLIWTVGVCLVISVCVCGGYSLYTDVYGKFGSENDKYVDIVAGSGINAISDILYENGIIKYPNVFKMFAKRNENAIYQQGTHILNENMSYEAIINALQKPPISNDQLIKLTVPEGYELEQIAELAEEKGIASREDFLREANYGKFEYNFVKDIKRTENRLEGYLFPATYEIYIGESVHNVIDKMLEKFSEVVLPIYESSQTDKTLDEIVIMASIVEKEAANDDERAKIASVFYNRIKNDMTLSSCATVQYVLEERKPILSNSDIKIQSEYNTYIHKGLPIGPIAMPGEMSIKAAIYPADTDYLYFAADNGKNVFSRTDTEHLENVRRIQN